MSDRILYELEGCPFCAKVKHTLDDLGLDYETRSVPAAHAERTDVKALTGQTGVPVLVDEAHDIDGMYESTDIVAYLERTYGDAT